MSDAASQFLRRFTLLCLALFLSACAGQQRPANKRSSLIAGTDLIKRFASPARWHYHPRQAAELQTRLELPSGDVLFAGGRGERWLFDAKHKRVSAASQLASETLIAVLALPDRRWLFVGESGTGYEAREPLGQFLRSNPPVDPLQQVAAHGSSIAGVRF